ncbi:MAG TPA: AraC family transcriptional regulator [Flavisolibacter sp.]
MQQEFRFFIKGMVCHRCTTVISRTLGQLGITPVKATLGEVTILTTDSEPDQAVIEKALQPLGFSLLEDRKVKIVKEIRSLVQQVYSGAYDFPDNFRFSDLLVKQFHREYDTLSSLFALLEQQTLERYIINYRIEKVKELLVYTGTSISDIAFRLNYSSVAHLSRQFKQHTGLTLSHFRDIRKERTDVVVAS